MQHFLCRSIEDLSESSPSSLAFLFFFFWLANNYFTMLWYKHWCNAIHQHKSATGIHMSLLSWTPLPPPSPSHPSKLSQSTGFEFPAPYSKLPVAVYFTYGNISVSILNHPTLSFPHLVQKSVLYVSFADCKWDHQCYLLRFHAAAA